jgi:hypothetical protein
MTLWFKTNIWVPLNLCQSHSIHQAWKDRVWQGDNLVILDRKETKSLLVISKTLLVIQIIQRTILLGATQMMIQIFKRTLMRTSAKIDPSTVLSKLKTVLRSKQFQQRNVLSRAESNYFQAVKMWEQRTMMRTEKLLPESTKYKFQASLRNGMAAWINV